MTTSKAKNTTKSLFRWRLGRQNDGEQFTSKHNQGAQSSAYQKMLLATCSKILPFDAYLLKFPTGAEISPHRDTVADGRHFRLNIVLKKASQGGQFICSKTLFRTQRIALFRPDLQEHAVTSVAEGTRYVLSIGWVLREK